MLAADALEAGLDGPTIRRVAGLIQPSGYETDHLTAAFMSEVCLAEISKKAAYARLVQTCAREIIETSADPLCSTRKLYDLWVAAEYPDIFEDIALFDDDGYDFDLEERRTMIRKRLMEVAKTNDVP